MKINRNTKRSFGFTLVELLVVIAIIAVLVGLSAIGYNKVRKSAKNVNSVSNLRNIGAMLGTWSVSHNGAYPAINSPEGEPSDFHLWHWKLYDVAYDNKGAPVPNKKWEESVFYNPLIQPSDVSQTTTGYAMNSRLIQDTYDDVNSFSEAIVRPLRIVSLKNPSNSPIVASRLDYHYDKASELLYDDNGKTPILFCDGHVASFSLLEYESEFESEFESE